MASFSTKFNTPVKFTGYALSLGIIIDAGAPAPLYFQRRYLDINRQLLETKSTLIPQESYGKYLRLNVDDPVLPCAAFVETDITDDNTNTSGACPDGASIPAAPILVIDDSANTAAITMLSGFLNKSDYEFELI